MARYIDADKFECAILHEDIEIAKHKCKDFESYIGGAEQFRFQVKNAISKQPTADVVEIVRCKDCKYCRPRNKSEKRIYFEGVLICESCQMADEPCAVCEDDFCSYGERKEKL